VNSLLMMLILNGVESGQHLWDEQWSHCTDLGLSATFDHNRVSF